MCPEYKLYPEYLFPILADNLFCDLTLNSLSSLGKIKQTKEFRKGETLFSPGQMPCCIYVLREGEAQIVLTDGQRILTARPVETSEIIGLTEAIANLPYEISAEAVTSCVCECVQREDFIRFLHDEPEVCFRLTQMLGLNLQKSYKLVVFSIN